jgi:hypothetical protein
MGVGGSHAGAAVVQGASAGEKRKFNTSPFPPFEPGRANLADSFFLFTTPPPPPARRGAGVKRIDAPTRPQFNIVWLNDVDAAPLAHGWLALARACRARRGHALQTAASGTGTAWVHFDREATSLEDAISPARAHHRPERVATW